jgi:hypothetical protein
MKIQKRFRTNRQKQLLSFLYIPRHRETKSKKLLMWLAEFVIREWSTVIDCIHLLLANACMWAGDGGWGGGALCINRDRHAIRGEHNPSTQYC